MDEQERKKMLGEQAVAMFAMLWRSAFFVVVISFSAVLASPWEHMPEFARSYAGVFVVIFFVGVLIAGFKVLQAMRIINEPVVSNELNNKASEFLEVAGWLMFLGITSAAVITALLVLGVIEGIELSPVRMLITGVVILVLFGIIAITAIIMDRLTRWISRKIRRIIRNSLKN